MIASIEPNDPESFPGWRAQIVRHDGQADPIRKGFDGRDVAPGLCAPWRFYPPGGPKFSGKRLPIFAAVYSRPGLDQMGGCASESRPRPPRCGTGGVDRPGI